MISRLLPQMSARPLLAVRAAIIGVTLLALGIIWFGTLASTAQNERQAAERIRTRALIQARAAGATVQAGIERFDFALRTARIAALESPAAVTLQSQLVTETMPPGLVLQQFRIDADGYLAYSSLGQAPRNFLGDRDYFRQLATDHEDRLAISPPILGRLTGKWSIQVARAIRRDGRFEGVVSLAVSPDVWTEQLSRFESGPRDTLTLLSPQGHILLRTLNPGAHYGKQVPPQREYLVRPDLKEGDYVAHASVDGILRQYGWTRLPSGLVMMSGIALDDALAPMHAQNTWAIQQAGIFSALLTIVVLGLLVALKRYERAVDALADREEHLSEVLDYMAEGIVIVDTGNRIVDINPAFSAITGFGADELRGQHISALPAGRVGGRSLGELFGPADLHHQRGDFEGRRRDGEAYTGHAVISAVLDADGGVVHRVALVADVTELRRRDGEIWHQANFDRLTGLPNRSLITDRLESMVYHARRHQSEVVVLFIDLDRFKPVNDRYGHDVGDLLLQQVAQRLQKLFRDEDTVARLGGDEFVVAMPTDAGSAAIEPAAAKVVEALSQPFEVDGHQLSIACSVGVARFPADGDSAERLLVAADHAMYRAKNAGRARWSA
jgi:diguanylate cyclase (GGDEF)-like protein/PAS domain S-box-containing protein